MPDKKYVMQVLTRYGDEWVWRPVHPSCAKDPYIYDSWEAADWMLRICYPSQRADGTARVAPYEEG